MLKKVPDLDDVEHTTSQSAETKEESMNDKIFKKLDSVYGEVSRMERHFEDLCEIAQTIDRSFQPVNLSEYVPIHQKSLAERIHIIDCRIYEIESAMREVVTFLQVRLEDDFKGYERLSEEE